MIQKKGIQIPVFLCFTLFPLIFTNYYFNITITKYRTFAILALCIFLMGIFYTIRDKVFPKFNKIMLCFLISCTISCLLSKWKWESFTGESGKHIGLVFLLLCGGAYFGITRYMTLSKWLKAAFPIILTLTCLMALIQFCGWDFLCFYENMAAGSFMMYISTFGHVDVFSAFLSIYLPVCLWLFCHSQKNIRLLYGISCLFGILGVFCSNSDSAYLGLGTSMAVLLVLSFRTPEKVLSYVYLLWIYSGTAIFWNVLPIMFPDQIRMQSRLTAFFTSSGTIMVVLCISVILYLWARHHMKSGHPFPKLYSRIICGILFILLFTICSAFIYFTWIDRETSLGMWENYLRYNEHWGSDRGYVWNWLTQFFADAPLSVKLFGTGPDTTTQVLYENFYQEMVQELGVYYASAHNEYLNYLVNIGLVGTILYFSLLISSLIQCVKKVHSDSFYGAIALAIVSYSVMATVNISQPITVPFIYLFIALAHIPISSQVKKESLI